MSPAAVPLSPEASPLLPAPGADPAVPADCLITNAKFNISLPAFGEGVFDVIALPAVSA
jgi:hypothetical protein